MRKTILCLAFLGLLMTSCSNDNNVVEGVLSIKLIDFSRFFELSEKESKKIDSLLQITDTSKLEGNDALVYYICKDLQSENLLNQPYIYLMDKSGERIRLFLKDKDYQKIQAYNTTKLQANHKTLRIKARVKKVLELESDFWGDRNFMAEQLIFVKEEDGVLDVDK